jgi:hypothetical protein
MVGTQMLLLWLNLQASSPAAVLKVRRLKENYQLLVPLLAGCGPSDDLPGMAIKT